MWNANLHLFNISPFITSKRKPDSERDVKNVPIEVIDGEYQCFGRDLGIRNLDDEKGERET